MFKFKLGRKQPEDNEARRRLQKELFGFSKICDRGFPSRPSAIAYDPQLKLIAIGTHAGEIRIYGQPNFQVSYNLNNPSSIRKIIFLNGIARVLILTSDGYLHLLEINNLNSIHIDHICTSNENSESILKDTQTLCLLRNNLNLLIGLHNGNIYSFNIENFSLNTKPIIPTEIIEKIIVENCSGRIIHPGSVQSIVQHPINDDKVLIGYKNTLIVHWDLPSNSHDRTYIYKQEVESVCWYNQGRNFATCHSNGSYALWDAKQQLNIVETEKIPYGPYPCIPMTKINVKIMRNGDPLIIFSGGLPRSSYSNKHTVSCLCENEHNNERTRHVTFDFTTGIIDFFTIDKLSSDGSRDDPQSLVILLNEEIVMVDLLTDSWPSYHLPYLNSIHASPIICTTFACNVNQEFHKKLINYALIQFEENSDRQWLITGGEIKKIINDDSQEKNLLLTGHEDGSIQFWDVTNISMPLICKLKTSDYFQIEQAPNDDVDEETWPPFRKTGIYDPYCDDPRLAIQKLALCTNTDTLIAAGTAGQVLAFQFTAEPTDVNLPMTTVNLLDGCESFVWKGHEEMKTKSTFVSSGFLATSCIQLYPPAAVSALALCSDIQCYAVGTAHGFALINYQQSRILTAKCTLDPNSLGHTSKVPSSFGESTLIRGRSLKKSLRESFRRFRKGRTIKKSTMTPTTQRADESHPLSATNMHLEEITRVPIERQVEFREFKQNDDQTVSMVRCLYFAKTYLNSLHDRTRSLWAGTNGGHVYVYSIIGFESQTLNRTTITTDQTSSCSLAKEIRLKHKAPVLSIIVLDGLNQSIGQGSNIPLIDSKFLTTEIPIQTTPTHSENVTSHKVLICSEEQFKIFTLPHLKPSGKFKLTATEGTRVRKININQFASKTDNPDESHSEYCLTCLDNMGHISIYSLPTFRRQILFNCVKPTDITALSSLQFTPYAHAFYLQSSSEFTEVTFSLKNSSPCSMMISYDKLQRKTILRSNEDQSSQQISSKRDESHDHVEELTHEILSKDSICSSTPKTIDNKNEYEEPESITIIKSNPNENNSGFSTNSDSAIDLNSMNITNNQPSNDEVLKPIEHDPPSFQSTPLKVTTEPSITVSQNGDHASISPVLSKSSKKAAPPPPPPPKPAKLISVKVRQAPTINEVHCYNGTNNKSSSPSQQTPAIHT
ncbi:unnamed protein product [Rotaria magnacalcarata]|uniref:Lethal giant larvae homologue 2 domain-containing protein n=1 Tax=Rotaria magnacalcarata TaxID=392030 RepID=A0A816Z8F4_9BILA|nr:unnamed protein product [Rotaria magnacalcarata]CAF2010983.1 unnamed protein product [Rotaria magnacalcarata]CAF2197022.1 unnamed protein product [Rotaria magnacalcarata]